MEAGSPIAASRQRTEAEVCFGQTRPKMLLNMQRLSPEAAGCSWSPAHRSRGMGAQEIADSPPHALGMK